MLINLLVEQPPDSFSCRIIGLSASFTTPSEIAGVGRHFPRWINRANHFGTFAWQKPSLFSLQQLEIDFAKSRCLVNRPGATFRRHEIGGRNPPRDMLLAAINKPADPVPISSVKEIKWWNVAQSEQLAAGTSGLDLQRPLHFLWPMSPPDIQPSEDVDWFQRPKL